MMTAKMLIKEIFVTDKSTVKAFFAYQKYPAIRKTSIQNKLRYSE